MIICNEPAQTFKLLDGGSRDEERHYKFVIVFDFDFVHSLSGVFDEVSDLKAEVVKRA